MTQSQLHKPTANLDYSAVVPTYNRAGRLHVTLRSIVTQTLRPKEIIVVDDGSIDNTEQMILESFPDVNYIYQSNTGVSAARNRGIRAANCTWIALLDSDDVWMPTKLARQAEALEAHPKYRLIHCDEIWLRDGLVLTQKAKHRKQGGWIFDKCLKLCVISPSATVVHRSLFEDIGYFDESLPACEDYDLWLRITAQEPVLFVDEPLLIKHGGHADQLSRSTPALDRFRIKALINLFESDVLSNGQSEILLATLADKLEIYITGARKRGHTSDAHYHESLRCQFCPR